MPVGHAALQAHVGDKGPHLFHVTSLGNRDAILGDGLRPGSEVGRYEHHGFFQTRPGHVYICDLATVPVVPTAGSRLTLSVDLRELDPARFDTDEDVPYNAERFGGQRAWYQVRAPRLRGD